MGDDGEHVKSMTLGEESGEKKEGFDGVRVSGEVKEMSGGVVVGGGEGGSEGGVNSSVPVEEGLVEKSVVERNDGGGEVSGDGFVVGRGSEGKENGKVVENGGEGLTEKAEGDDGGKDENSEVVDGDGNGSGGNNLEVRRKRGRPRKVDTVEGLTEKAEGDGGEKEDNSKVGEGGDPGGSGGENLKSPRRRGRPRKVDRVEGLNEKAEGDGGENDDISKVGDGGEPDSSGGNDLITPRRRGRPRKVDGGDKSSSGVKGDEDEIVPDNLGSISRRTRNRVVRGKKEEVKDMDIVQTGGESEDEDGQGGGFSVGDFIWGKIKSHPWWPGRVCDSSDASEYALKYKHEGRLLVAYFGDGTFAWCDASQLKPFVEDFEEMSEQSSIKSFVNAVDEAVSEFVRLLELQMAHSGTENDSQSSLPLMVNAGIKEGVHVPLNGVGEFLISHLEPVKLLSDINGYASTVSVTNMLELSVLKHRLSVFYHARGGYSLPVFLEPVRIEGLLDNSDTQECSARGPVDGDWCVGPGEHPLPQTGPETGNHVSGKSKKEKSLAELLGVNPNIELEANSVDNTEGEGQSGAASKPGRRRRKLAEEGHNAVEESKDDEISVVEEKAQLEKLAPKSGHKRRKISDENPNDVVGDSKATRSSARKKEGSAKATIAGKKAPDGEKGQQSQQTELAPKSGRKRPMIIDDSQSPVLGNLMATRSSRRKKEKSTKSTTSEQLASGNVEGGHVGKAKGKMDKIPREKRLNVSVEVDNGVAAEEVFDRVSPREKKKSKYLSPPYTTPQQRLRHSSLLSGSDAGGLEFSDVARVGERMTKAASNLVGSPPTVKCSAETFQKSANGSSSAHDKTVPSRLERKAGMSTAVDVSVKKIRASDKVLKKIRSAALDPLNATKGQSLDSTREFLSSYRDANYKNGSDYKSYKKLTTSERKRKSNLAKTKQESNPADQQTPEPKSLGRRSSKKKGLEIDHGLADESPSSAALLVTFPTKFTFPSKEDLLKLHSKYGVLDESKTEVVQSSSTAKIVFVNRSDAEAAMDSIRKSNPFGTGKVRYKIQQLANISETKKGDTGKKKSSKSSGSQLADTSETKNADTGKKKRKKSSKSSGSQVDKSDAKPSVSAENESLTIVFIKQKLAAMNLMLSHTDGKMTDEVKSNLENEAKDLLKKVKMMTAGSSTSS